MTLTPDTTDGTIAGDMADTAVLPRPDELPDPIAGPPNDESVGGAPEPSPWKPDFGPLSRNLRRRFLTSHTETWMTFLVVLGCSLFVFFNAHPEMILRNTTPTGGDMGAHVWGPNYLMHHLLPHGKVSGWTPDWYAGFPAFQFYMVLPALAIVALNIGVRSVLVVPAIAIAVSVAASGWLVPALRRWRRLLFGVGVVLVVFTVPVPYDIAFKLITVSGMVALPIAAWAFGRLSGLAFPGPPLMSLGALFFIYNREPNLNGGTGNIIGGNMASTMAGEFAFSIGLTLCLLYLGFLVNGLRTGRFRCTAAVLLALCGLCHLIPVFFALVATLIALVVWPGRQRLKWILPVLPVAGLLSAFWVVPFLLRHPFVNDMGWEKLPQPNSTNLDKSPQTIWNYLLAHALWWPLALAAVGLVVSIVYRYRAGFLLAATLVGSGVAFVWMPQYRLWNARVLPFYYLSLFLLAAVGVSEVVRSVATLAAKDPEKPGVRSTSVGLALCACFTLVFVGVPLGRLPGTTYPTAGGVTWLRVFHRDYRNDIPGWAKWNFEGLEAKKPVGPGAKIPEGQGGWPEYRAMVAAMAKLGADPGHGCGRAFWEYGERLETYGTPMAPMMLPYFTDGCIGSMEGLYFESSATTPHHFLTQCALSAKGSCAQRDLDYGSFDLDLGLQQIGLLGVKYYMAFSDQAVAAANASPKLDPVAVSGPWHIYQLKPEQSSLVTPLSTEPVVMANVDDTQNQWLDPAAAWFLQPDRWDVMLAGSGPKDWARVTLPDDPIQIPDAPLFVKSAQAARVLAGRAVGERAPGDKRKVGARTLPTVPKNAVTPAAVSNITTGDDRISFDVDRVGSPVLVKVSYFPNWKVDGAEGPYRVAPNLMVVVPTSKHVSLHFGRTNVEYLATIMTLLGLIGLLGMSRLPAVAMPQPKVRPPRIRSAASGPPGIDPAVAPETLPAAGADTGADGGAGYHFTDWLQAVAQTDPELAGTGAATTDEASPGADPGGEPGRAADPEA